MAGKRKTALMTRQERVRRMPVRRGEFVALWNTAYIMRKQYERDRKWYRRAWRWLRGERGKITTVEASTEVTPDAT